MLSLQAKRSKLIISLSLHEKIRAVPDEDANYFDVTGTPTVTSISATNLDVGALVRFHFDSAATLTHNASNLVLPAGVNLTVTAGDEFTFIQYR